MRPEKDQYYLDIAAEVAKRSTCLRRQYGKYQISILIDEHEDLYFVKWKNDILVEMVNLSDRRKRHEKLFKLEVDT